MGHWGIAYASGPFYNKPWHWYGEQERIDAIANCHHHTQQASRLLKHPATEVERALINALCCKHPCDKADSNDPLTQWMQDYADAMQNVYRTFSNDLDVICLAAEALLNLTPWKLWDLNQGVPAENAQTDEAIKVLEHGLALIESTQLEPHPGILHFYIHVYEMSPTPEKALPSANLMRDLCPDAGHLLHMASHIDSLCGDWQNAANANDRAITADRLYLSQRSADEFYMISVVHNFDFKIWASMFLGQFQPALQAADGICDLVRDHLIIGDTRYLASTLEGYYAGRAHVLVRFGQWQQICDEEMPSHPEAVPITTLLLIYAKAIAFAALGKLEQARHYQREYLNLYQEVPEWHIMANNPTRDILAVGQAMMSGEVEYHAGHHDLGFSYLREACFLSDELNYSEPWPWMHPPRHALGALLLEQNRTEEALICYQDDLGIGNRLPRCAQHPGNIWALHGYSECLVRLGRDHEAAAFKPQLDHLIQQSDVVIRSSCCCSGMNSH